MKIAAFLDVSVHVGGGFNQALNAILQMKRLAAAEFEFVVYTTISENLDLLGKLGVTASLVKISWKDKFIYVSSLTVFGCMLQRKLKMTGSLETVMMGDEVTLVYYVQPHYHCRALQHLNYIMTVWDVCHRDTPEFPEMRSLNEFHMREHFLKSNLAPALLVLTDSQLLSKRISDYYNVALDRLLAMPFSPSPLVGSSFSVSESDVMAVYNLEPGYFFYPAQLWPHKNHVRILQALAELKDNFGKYQVVFAGGEKGNKKYLESVSVELGVADQTHFLGFVPAEHMRGLYLGCRALLMASYFGPTNLPPLEAFSLGKPVIYPRDFSDQTGDAALYFDLDNFKSLAGAMESVFDVNVAARLVEKGFEQLEYIAQQRTDAESKLLQILRQFTKRRQCWE